MVELEPKLTGLVERSAHWYIHHY